MQKQYYIETKPDAVKTDIICSQVQEIKYPWKGLRMLGLRKKGNCMFT